MKDIKKQRIHRAKICFLYYSLHIFKNFVRVKTHKHVPRYMGKATKQNNEEKYYEDKFKSIPPSYLKVKGVKYLRKQVNKPIGMIERMSTMPAPRDIVLSSDSESKSEFSKDAKQESKVEPTSEQIPADMIKKREEIPKNPAKKKTSFMNLKTFAHKTLNKKKSSSNLVKSNLKKQSTNSIKTEDLYKSDEEPQEQPKDVNHIIRLRIQKTFEEESFKGSSSSKRSCHKKSKSGPYIGGLHIFTQNKFMNMTFTYSSCLDYV